MAKREIYFLDQLVALSIRFLDISPLCQPAIELASKRVRNFVREHAWNRYGVVEFRKGRTLLKRCSDVVTPACVEEGAMQVSAIFEDVSVKIPLQHIVSFWGAQAIQHEPLAEAMSGKVSRDYCIIMLCQRQRQIAQSGFADLYEAALAQSACNEFNLSLDVGLPDSAVLVCHHQKLSVHLLKGLARKLIV
eukprot:6193569-Pleurochrysis_carterae.AAC.1